MRGGLSKDPAKRARQLANLRTPKRVTRPARKNCSKCGRWKLAMEFSPRSRGNRLAPQCRTCQRLAARERGGHRPRRYDHCLRGHRLSGDNLYTHRDGGRRCKACWRIAHAAWVERNRESIREYERIYHEAKRREAGVPARRPDREAPKTPDHQTVPAGPFGEWLRRHSPPDQRPASLAFLNEYRAEPFQRWAKSLGLDGSQARKIMRGQQKTVSFDVVDRALVEAGEPHMLNELYPIEVAA